MKKIIIGILVVTGIGVFIMNNLVHGEIEKELYSKIEKSNQSKNGQLGSIIIDIKKENISCGGFVIYNCKIANPIFGIKGVGEKLFKSDDIILEDLNIITDPTLKMNINKLDLIDHNLITVKNTFPLDLKVGFKQIKDIYKIKFNAVNESAVLDFNANLKELSKNDSKIIDYKLTVKNKKIKTFIYEIYKSFLEQQLPELRSMVNESIFGIKTSEIQNKEKLTEKVIEILSVSVKDKEASGKLKDFLNNKNAIITFDVTNKTDISINQMLKEQEELDKNFNIIIGVKK